MTKPITFACAVAILAAAVACSSGSSGGGGGAGADAGSSNCSWSPPTPLPVNLACLPNTPCASNQDCGSGYRCNLALSPPACEKLYCGGTNTPCSEQSFCATGLKCHKGLCVRCNVCGSLCEVDFQHDPDNCGCCNTKVPAGGVCDNGVPSCPSGTKKCGDKCVDVQTDPQNCGTCGHALAAGLVCVNGQAGCSNPRYSICGDKCVDLESDKSNCGACGATCKAGYCTGSPPAECDVLGSVGQSCAATCASDGMKCLNLHNDAQYDGYCGQSAISLGCQGVPAAQTTCTFSSGTSCKCDLTEVDCSCAPVN